VLNSVVLGVTAKLRFVIEVVGGGVALLGGAVAGGHSCAARHS
jgi:hypothetical protein